MKFSIKPTSEGFIGKLFYLDSSISFTLLPGLQCNNAILSSLKTNILLVVVVVVCAMDGKGKSTTLTENKILIE